MLKLGEQNISGLYLGEEKIEKAYLGETLVFSGEKTITVNTTDSALTALLNAGELTVAGDRITQVPQTVYTVQTQVEVKFALTGKTLSKGRIVTVNGENIGTVKNLNDSIATMLPAQENMTINIVFTMQ